jgi:peptide/nickel transport system permease protein
VNVRWLVARRVVLAVVSVYLVFSLAFAFVALTPDPNLGQIRFGAAMSCEGTSEERAECIEQRMSAYREANNLDESFLERYVRWMVAMSTLNWGASHAARSTVLSVIGFSLPYTLLYVVPSMVLSTAGGLATGAYLALSSREHADRAGTALAYLGYGLPNFWVAALLMAVLGRTYDLPGAFFYSWDPTAYGDPLSVATLVRLVLPVAVLSTTLFASQMRHARAETLEQLGSELVKVVRAKGYGDRGVARHVLRLAAPLLLSLFVVDLFGVIVVNIFVIEFVFQVPGFGRISLTAFKQRDMPLLLGTTMVFAIVGIAGNMLKDIATLALDPRIGDGGE